MYGTEEEEEEEEDVDDVPEEDEELPPTVEIGGGVPSEDVLSEGEGVFPREFTRAPG